MNSKKAKAYRLIVKQMVEKGVITKPETIYLKKKGIDTGQRILSPSCARGFYRILKKQGINAIQPTL